MQQGLKVGDKLPLFGAKDQKGEDFYIASVLEKKVLVIYFYPKDDTPGCTKQACFFRDQYEDFKDLGAEVIGISRDSVASHQKFTQQFQLPFILLSDHDKKIRKLFGVSSGLFGILPGRVTYVTDKTGKLVGILDPKEKDDLIITCKSGITLRTPIANIKEAGRATQGVKLIRLDESDEIAAISRIDEQEAEEVIEQLVEGAGDDSVEGNIAADDNVSHINNDLDQNNNNNSENSENQ